MSGFNLNATVNLQPPRNIKETVDQIRQQLKSLSATVDVQVNPRSINNVQDLVRQLNQTINSLKAVSAEAGNSASGFNSLASSYNNVNRSAAQLNNNLLNTANAARQAGLAMRDGATFANQFGEQAGFAVRRFAAFTLAAGSITALIFAFKNSIQQSLEFERSIVRLGQIANDNANDLNKLAAAARNLSVQFGVPAKELLDAAGIFRQARVSIDDTAKAMEALAKASLTPGFDNIKDTAQSAIAILSQFKIPASELEKSLSSINAVSQNFAVSQGDILEAIQRTGGAFKAVGGNLNELIALFTAVKSTTRESSQSIATGLRTIFTRLQRNEVVEDLNQLGIKLRYTKEEADALGNSNLTGQFVGAYEAIKRLSQGLSQLQTTDPKFSRITEQLGGYREIAKVIPLVQELGKAQQVLNVSKYGSASLDVSAIKAQEAYLQQAAKVKQEFFELGRLITDDSFFKKFLNDVLLLAEAFTKLAQILTPLIPLLTTIATVRIAQGAFNFLPSFASVFNPASRPTRRAEGGLIGFARGGEVPGVGNSDSVPAMLQPGEFVIKQSSARSLGYTKLHSLNNTGDGKQITTGYARGGRVRKYADGDYVNPYGSSDEPFSINVDSDERFLRVGRARLNPVPRERQSQINVQRPSAALVKSLAYTAASSGQQAPQTAANALELVNNIEPKFQLKPSDLVSFTEEKGERLAPKEVVQGYHEIAEKDRKLAYNIFRTQTAGNISSNVFKDRAKAAEAFQDRQSQKEFFTVPLPGDIIGGIGFGSGGVSGSNFSVTDIGGRDLSLSKGIRDALKSAGVEKISANVQAHVLDPNVKEFFSKEIEGRIASSLARLVQQAFHSKFITDLKLNPQEISNISGILLQSVLSRLSNHGGITNGTPSSTLFDISRPIPTDDDIQKFITPSPTTFSYGDIKRTLDPKNIASIAGKYVNLKATQIAGLLGKNVKKFAVGGMVPGYGNGDSVPALLTPGEFVIKKDSAQKLGYGNLDRLNRGGSVRHFEVGGLTYSDLDKKQLFGLNDNLNLTRNQLDDLLYLQRNRPVREVSFVKSGNYSKEDIAAFEDARKSKDLTDKTRARYNTKLDKSAEVVLRVPPYPIIGAVGRGQGTTGELASPVTFPANSSAFGTKAHNVIDDVLKNYPGISEDKVIIKGNVDKYVISNQAQNVFANGIETQLHKAADDFLGKFAVSPKVAKSLKLSAADFNKISGVIFEKYLGAITDTQVTDAQAPFDYDHPNTEAFGRITNPKFRADYADAKLSLDAGSVRKLLVRGLTKISSLKPVIERAPEKFAGGGYVGLFSSGGSSEKPVLKAAAMVSGKGNSRIPGFISSLAEGGDVTNPFAEVLQRHSDANIQTYQGFLNAIGLGHVRVSGLVNGLYNLDPYSLNKLAGTRATGVFRTHTHNVGISKKIPRDARFSRIETLAHEILGHGADALHGFEQNDLYSTRRGGLFNDLGREGYDKLVSRLYPGVLDPYETEVIAPERLAYTTQIAVQKLAADKGIVKPTPEQKTLFGNEESSAFINKFNSTYFGAVGNISRSNLLQNKLTSENPLIKHRREKSQAFERPYLIPGGGSLLPGLAFADGGYIEGYKRFQETSNLKTSGKFLDAQDLESLAYSSGYDKIDTFGSSQFGLLGAARRFRYGRLSHPKFAPFTKAVANYPQILDKLRSGQPISAEDRSAIDNLQILLKGSRLPYPIKLFQELGSASEAGNFPTYASLLPPQGNSRTILADKGAQALYSGNQQVLLPGNSLINNFASQGNNILSSYRGFASGGNVLPPVHDEVYSGGKRLSPSAIKPFLMHHYASGGESTDTVPALLTPGEFVLNRDAVSKIGVSRLHQMNAQGYAIGGYVQRFADGSQVQPSIAKAGGVQAIDFNLFAQHVGDATQALALLTNAFRQQLEKLTPKQGLENVPGTPQARARDEKLDRLAQQQATKTEVALPFSDQLRSEIPQLQKVVESAEERARQANSLTPQFETATKQAASAYQSALSAPGFNQANPSQSTGPALAFLQQSQQKAQLASQILQKQQDELRDANKLAEITKQTIQEKQKQLARHSEYTNVLVRQKENGELELIGSQKSQQLINAGGPGLSRLQRFSKGISQFGAFAIGTGLSYAANAIQPAPLTSEINAAAFQNRSAVAGGLTGAAIGTSIGGSIALASGGTLAIPGLILGAAVGAATAFKDAEKEIRQVKIGNALTELNKVLSGLASGTLQLTSENINKATISFNKSLENLDKEALDKSTHFLGGLNADELKENRQRLISTNFAQSTPQLVGALNRLAEQTGKRGGTPAEFTAENTTLISNLARVTDETFKNIAENFEKVVTDTIRQDKLGKISEQTVTAMDHLFTSLGRMTEAVSAATDSVAKNRSALASLGESLNLGTKPTFTGFAGLNSIGAPNNAQFNTAISNLSGFLGGSAGQELKTTASNIGSLRQVLPSVLADAFRNNLKEGEPFANQVRQGLNAQFAGNNNPNLATQIDFLVNEIAKKQPEQLRQESGGDVTKITDKLLGSSFQNLQAVLKDLGTQIPAHITSLNNGLDQFYRSLEQTRQAVGQLADVELAGTRNKLEDFAESIGRSRTSAIDFLSLGQLQKPFNTRLNSLTTFGGAAGNTAEEIGKRLAEVEEQKAAAQSKASRTGSFVDLNALDKLTSQATALRQALQLLGDVSQRNAAVQEKLNRIEQDRAGRVAFGERFLGGSPEERLHLERGAFLTTIANQRGNLRGFTGEENRSIFDFLNSLGSSKLEGFGGIHANELKEQLVRASGFEVSPETAKQEKTLQGLRQTGFDEAAKAFQVSIASQESLQARFFTELQTINKNFLSNLDLQLLAAAKRDAEVSANNLAFRQRDIQNVAKQGELVNNLTGGINIDTLKNFKGKFEELFNVNNEAIAAKKNVTDISKIVTAENLKPEELSKVPPDQLANKVTSIISAKLIASGNKNFKEEDISTLLTSFFNKNVFNTSIRSTNPQDSAIRSVVLDNLRKELSRFYQGQFNTVNDKRKNIRSEIETGSDITDENLHSVESFALKSKEQRDDFLAGISRTSEEYRKNAESAVEAAKNLKIFTDSIDNLNSKINANLSGKLKNDIVGISTASTGALPGFANGGVVEYFNKGNSVFEPKGTDTVPAMLTPGEYVVNKDASRKHYKLLSDINSGRLAFGGTGKPEGDIHPPTGTNNPIHLASGGLAGDIEEAFKHRPLTAAERKRVDRYTQGGYKEGTDREHPPILFPTYTELDSVGIPVKNPSTGAKFDPKHAYQSKVKLPKTPQEKLRDSTFAGTIAKTAENPYLQSLGVTPNNLAAATADRGGASAQFIAAKLAQASVATPGNLLIKQLEINNRRQTERELEKRFGREATIPVGGYNPFEPNNAPVDEGHPDEELLRGSSALSGQTVAQVAGAIIGSPVKTPGQIRREQQIENLKVLNDIQAAAAGANAAVVTNFAGQYADLSYRQLLAHSTLGGQTAAAQRGFGIASSQQKSAANQRNLHNNFSTFNSPDFYTTPQRRGNTLNEDTLSLIRASAAGGIGLVPGYATGGYVDSVHAMLSPGEFVMTAKATQSIGAHNLETANHFAAGGIVPKYLANGGNVTAPATNSIADGGLTEALNAFVSKSQQLATAFASFTNLKISLEGTHKVEVVVNGAQVLTGLEPSIKALVLSETQKALQSAFEKHMPELPTEFNQ